MTTEIGLMRKMAFPCIDCGMDTLIEHFTVWDHLWLEAVPEYDGDLCIGCLECRLGRRLTAADFPPYPINDINNGWAKSDRLTERLMS